MCVLIKNASPRRFQWVPTTYETQNQKKYLLTCRFRFRMRFYGPVNPTGSCRAWSVYLTSLLLGRLIPLSGLYIMHIFFARNWQLPFLNQRKGENDRRKYFMINLHERILLIRRGRTRNLLITSRPRIQESHRGRWRFRSACAFEKKSEWRLLSVWLAH